MKKIFRYLRIVVGVFTASSRGVAAFFVIWGVPKFEAETIVLNVAPTPARVERGQKLATLLCRNCHLDPNTGKFTGKHLTDVPQFGDSYTKNISRDPEYGIGECMDGQMDYLPRC